jgi:hypothetical protein
LRPPIGSEAQTGVGGVVVDPHARTVTVDRSELRTGAIPQQGTETAKPPSNAVFKFDEVLPQSASQSLVFRRLGEPLVGDVLEGYNSCIMAFGQTGSGKTHSLANLSAGAYGLIPRCCAELFDRIAAQPDFEFTVRLSYLQIYLEMLQDLLVPDNTNLQIREEPSGGVYVAGASWHLCHNVRDVITLLEHGQRFKAIAQTSMNDHSSRSHTVLTLQIERRAVRREPGPHASVPEEPHAGLVGPSAHDLASERRVLRSKFVFVDLAGSERAARTHPDGLLLDEAKSINLSLSALSDVMQALSEQSVAAPRKGGPAPFVRWRGSKLTRLLQDTLGGNSRHSLLINISPCSSSLHETLTSLSFGRRAMSVAVHPRVNEDVDFEALCADLQSELDRVRDSFRAAHASLLLEADDARATARQLQNELESERVFHQNAHVAMEQANERISELEVFNERLAGSLREAHAKVREQQDYIDALESSQVRHRLATEPQGNLPADGPAPEEIARLLAEAEATGADSDVILALRELAASVAVIPGARPPLRDPGFSSLQKRVIDLQDSAVMSRAQVEEASRSAHAEREHAARLAQQVKQHESNARLLKETLTLAENGRDDAVSTLQQLQPIASGMARAQSRFAFAAVTLGQIVLSWDELGLLQPPIAPPSSGEGDELVTLDAIKEAPLNLLRQLFGFRVLAPTPDGTIPLPYQNAVVRTAKSLSEKLLSSESAKPTAPPSQLYRRALLSVEAAASLADILSRDLEALHLAVSCIIAAMPLVAASTATRDAIIRTAGIPDVTTCLPSALDTALRTTVRLAFSRAPASLKGRPAMSFSSPRASKPLLDVRVPSGPLLDSFAATVVAAAGPEAPTSAPVVSSCLAALLSISVAAKPQISPSPVPLLPPPPSPSPELLNRLAAAEESLALAESERLRAETALNATASALTSLKTRTREAEQLRDRALSDLEQRASEDELLRSELCDARQAIAVLEAERVQQQRQREALNADMARFEEHRKQWHQLLDRAGVPRSPSAAQTADPSPPASPSPAPNVTAMTCLI